ncbi:probable RNA methyltransferase At5g51130 isoform X2 [Tripterygium wilfordii]|uniref:probable RNA methyltransferase At5g51130 isoform X2 n=1 Tax=Tripterygium wilfordii TaxID=458696 RepID=UPI0018F8181D|nr:probable RNA methyltransferase At5g51130 isoform X2 [Tripterygium wilfordii]
MGEKKKNKSNSKVEEEPQQQEQQLSANKRKRKEVFPYGNYKAYYGYRIGQGIDEDPRLKVFKKEWFEGKDCLDIGCNSGVVTVQIAKKFHCRSILGIDIDYNLIQDAKWRLKQIMRKESAGENSTSACKSEVATQTNCSESSENAYSSEGTNEEDFIHPEINERKERPRSFLQNRCIAKKHYDTILCLSVAKWIHLNWGDDGLITLFSRVWELLHPGGIFVFEPQPWRSYESNRLVSETTARNCRDIKFRPDDFMEILLDKIGFRKVDDITSALSGSKTGFNRPIFVFHK